MKIYFIDFTFYKNNLVNLDAKLIETQKKLVELKSLN